MKDITSALKDRAILLGWIAGLVFIISLLWSFTFPLRSAGLMRAVNKTLTMADDSRQLSAPLLRYSAGPGPLGCWYTLSESNSLFYVFTVMKDGILVPCGAEISEHGKVLEIIPLGNHARQIMEQIPHGQMQIYIRRIESIVGDAGRGEG